MNITYQNHDTVNITSKGHAISIGAEVKVEDFVIPGAGEYDVSTIQCEATNLSSGIVYFLRTEDLTVTFLTELNSEVTQLDDASATNILIVDLRSDAKPEELKPILKSLEPSYLFLLGAGATPEFAQALNLPPYESTTLKVTRTSLPLEGTSLISRG